MAKYRKIDPRIWNDEKFQTLDPLDKLLAVYGLTGQTNRIGLFRFSIALAAEDLGLDPKDVRTRLDRVCHTLFWKYDATRRVLYLPRWWKYNNPGSGKTMKGLLEDVHEVPQTPLLNDFATNFEYLQNSLSDTLSVFFAKGMPYQEQEQEQEQDLKDPPCSPPSGDGGSKPKKKTKRSKASPSDSIIVGLTYPDGWNTPGVRASLIEWIDYKQKRGEVYKDPPSQLGKLLKQFARDGPPAQFIAAVDHSIANNWAGCHAPKDGNDKQIRNRKSVRRPDSPARPRRRDRGGDVASPAPDGSSRSTPPAVPPSCPRSDPPNGFG